jgi:hypothetical protein
MPKLQLRNTKKYEKPRELNSSKISQLFFTKPKDTEMVKMPDK